MAWVVADVMTRDVVTVSPSTPLDACLRTMRMHGVGALPVVRGENVVGIVTVTDMLMKRRRPTVRERYERSPEDPGIGMTAADVMSKRLIMVLPDTPLAAAVRQLFQHQINRLPVIDQDGCLVGIVSRSDVLRMFLRSDVAIRKDVDHAMVEDMPYLGKGTVWADVSDGVVTVNGRVEPGTLTSVLLRLVASVPGVVGVRSRLAVSRRRKRA